MNDAPPTHTNSTGIAEPISVTDTEVREFAVAIGLTHAAPGRCSLLLMFDLYCRAFFPVPGDPAKVVAEVRGLEGLGRPLGTKQEDRSRIRHCKDYGKSIFLVTCVLWL